jgi:anti-sigma regulatory factor (Ser/Thr protein kinase)
MKALQVKAEVPSWEAVMKFIEDELDSVGCPHETKMQIIIAAEEIFINIALYAYKDSTETGSAEIRAENGDMFMLEFEDGGTPYNPLEKADPDVTLEADEREIGGLGIYLVKDMMDVVDYRYEDGKNIFTIKKNF